MSFRCFLWLEEEEGRGRNRDFEENGEDGRGLREEGRGIGGWATGLGGEERDLEKEETMTLRRTKTGLGEGRKRDFEKEKKGNRESCDSKAVFR